MKRGITWVILAALLGPALMACGATGKVIKVLPHYLDREGRHARSPSLYDRDAYQAHLRKNPAERSGLRFDIQWKAKDASNLKLRVELRGMKEKSPQTRTLEQPVQKKGGFLSHWSAVTLQGDDYKKFGELSAWRVTLWDDAQMVGEQKSFLW